MKKIWNVVLTLSLILLFIGILCAGVSYALGGRVETLYENEAARQALTLLSPESWLPKILALFSF